MFTLSLTKKAWDCFTRFMAEVENQLQRSIKTLRTDRGREYLSELFKELCEKKGAPIRPEGVLHLGTTTRLAFFRKTGSLR